MCRRQDPGRPAGRRCPLPPGRRAPDPGPLAGRGHRGVGGGGHRGAGPRGLAGEPSGDGLRLPGREALPLEGQGHRRSRQGQPRGRGRAGGDAEGDTARQNRDRCQRAKAQGWSRQDAQARYAAIHQDRSCRTWTDTETGAFRLDARLTPDAGAALKAALQLESDRVFHRARRAGAKESPDAYAADALVALVTGGKGSSSSKTSDDPASDDKTPKRSKGTRALVHVRVDLDALRSGVVGPNGICEIPGVGPIPVDTARELMGDALCELVITNGIDVTTITKLGRAIPAALRRALDERDATCVVPGCDAVTGLEIDHRIVEVRDNGPTALWNLAKLCAHHHDLRHHKGFTLAGGPGHWQWIPPGGDPGPPRPRTKRPNRRNGRNGSRRSDRRPEPSEPAPRRFPKQE